MHAPATPAELAEALARGDRGAVARALNLLEGWRPSSGAGTDADTAAVSELLSALPVARLAGRATVEPGADDCALGADHFRGPTAVAPALANGHLIGVTGAPGVGKSSLIAALVRSLRARGQRIGVLAVDPSSLTSGGALLGDRIRIACAEPDDGLFIRSVASRGEQGGLSPMVFPMVQVLLAAFDRVLVETVGIGQSELDVAYLADTTCLVLQPDSGDAVQFLKAGVLELPELIVVNKADPPHDGNGEAQARAERTAVEVRASLGLPAANSARRPIPVVLTSARANHGIEALVEHLDGHLAVLRDGERLTRRRSEQAAAWGIKRLRQEFGQFGVDRLGGTERLTRRLGIASRCVVTELDLLRRELLASLAG